MVVLFTSEQCGHHSPSVQVGAAVVCIHSAGHFAASVCHHFCCYSLCEHRVCQARSAGGGLLHRGAAVATWLLLSPAFYVICCLALVCHGIGLPLPEWFEILGVELFSLYCLQSLAKTLFNALRQSIIQTSCTSWAMIHMAFMYIDTRLYLFSVVSLPFSVLKSLAVVMIECHTHSCRFADCCVTFLRESLGVYKELRGTSLSHANLVSRSSTSLDIPR